MTRKTLVRDGLISAILLVGAFVLSLQFQTLDVDEHITTVFVFAVFLVSLLTEGYVFGIASAVVGMFAVNFAFTYPYFALDFINPINLISAVIMLTVAIVTCLLVAKVKAHEVTRAESERERMRANLLRAVSHDLRTPLTTIYSAGSMLRDKPFRADRGTAERDAPKHCGGLRMADANGGKSSFGDANRQRHNENRENPHHFGRAFGLRRDEILSSPPGAGYGHRTAR